MSHGRPITVVGEIADVRQRDITIVAEPEILVPAAQQDLRSLSATISVRSERNATSLIGAVRAVFRELDPDLPLMKLTTMEAVVDESTATNRFLLDLFAAFAALAVILASLGLYSVISYLVAQRTREIGIRIALGARHRHVIVTVLHEGVILVTIGIAIGVPVALALSRAVSNFLYEVQPHDAVTFVAMPALLAVVALYAAYIPARRASKIDPMTMLRRE